MTRLPEQFAIFQLQLRGRQVPQFIDALVQFRIHAFLRFSK